MAVLIGKPSELLLQSFNLQSRRWIISIRTCLFSERQGLEPSYQQKQPSEEETDDSLRVVAASLILIGLVLILSACTTLPKDYDRAPSTAFADTDQTTLGRNLSPIVGHHPSESGVEPLNKGTDAFAARWILADVAERSLDVQYYIWHDDDTGKLLLRQLMLAADRGVRVRLLLDDIYTSTYDLKLPTLDQHPNIEVRVFNPFIARKRRALEGITNFSRVNRRMHNKSYTVDNQVTIVGGRNIGDIYFEARPDVNYADFDVMAVGPVVHSVSEAFDSYWNSNFAVPIGVLEEPGTLEGLEQTRALLEQHTETMRDSEYIAAVRSSAFIEQLKRGDLVHYWGDAQAVFDDPGKAAVDAGDPSGYIKATMRPILMGTNSELLIISAYFVPDKEVVGLFKQLRERGVRVRILTNSLATNDVPAVYAGYSRYRKPMLRAGVELYELKRTAVAPNRKSEIGLGGQSQAGLHSKTYVFDRLRTFIGSFNLDPRSRQINTELGILFENDKLAEFVVAQLDKTLDQVAFRLELREIPADDEFGITQSVLEWITEQDGEEMRFDTEPNTSVWQRIGMWFLSLLPIEGQL
jgi:putative cardiolipin synthase